MKDNLIYNIPYFPAKGISQSWTTTSNKQLNFVQHVRSMLKADGKAGVVVPVNVLFEGGAGEKVSSGIYLYRLYAGDRVKTGKMNFVK